MPTLQHSTLPSSSVHEPKHISTAGVSSAGKVLTSSASVSGESVFRFLVAQEIQNLEETLMVLEIDASVGQTHYIPSTYNGEITSWSAIVNQAIATATNSYELQIDGVPVTGSAISLTTAPGTGGTAGDIVSATPSAANTFVSLQSITIVPTATGNTDAATNVRFALTIRRT